MKKLLSILGAGVLLLAPSVLTGCVAIPPLINVQHKESPDLGKKLDAIEKRLQTLEQKLDTK